MHSTRVKWPNWVAWEKGEGRSQQGKPEPRAGPHRSRKTRPQPGNLHAHLRMLLWWGGSRVGTEGEGKDVRMLSQGQQEGRRGRGENQPTWQMEGPGGIVFSALMGLGNETFPLSHTLLESSKPLYTGVLNFQGTQVRQNISFPPVVSLTNYLRS